MTSASAGPSSSPLVKQLPRPPKAPKERQEKKGLQKSAFVEGEAEESDDEEAGFGGFGGVGRGREDEEEEDQDQPVEGLVDDEEMSEERKAEAEITRLELVRCVISLPHMRPYNCANLKLNRSPPSTGSKRWPLTCSPPSAHRMSSTENFARRKRMAPASTLTRTTRRSGSVGRRGKRSAD